jgi:hypothetical protein
MELSEGNCNIVRALDEHKAMISVNIEMCCDKYKASGTLSSISVVSMSSDHAM